MRALKDRAAYAKALEVLRRRRGGLTAADLAASAALPLPAARELLSRAADEFRGRLRVTESSEILYDFPRGFTSRYTGPAARFRRFTDKFLAAASAFLSWLFKAWILVMLLGYFALFMLIALAALVFSAAAGSSGSKGRSRDNSGGVFLAAHIFDLIIRLWFYSELTRSMGGSYRNSYGPSRKAPGAPLHKAVFSFVFGEKDPNGGADEADKKALIVYLRENRGLIALPEYMAVTGLPPGEAEGGILAFCAEFGGWPEATEEGTIVYRFQDILLRADGASPQRLRQSGGRLPDSPWRTRVFSSNGKTMNAWFALINSVNLLFGSYFFYQAFNTGAPMIEAQPRAAPLIYSAAYFWLSSITENPLPIIQVGLGLVPILFSFFFWLIPALRFARLGAENRKIRRRNLRKAGFRLIWEKIRGLRPADIGGPSPEYGETEGERIIVEMGTYSQPEVEADERGTVYNFTGLEGEKKALAAGRDKVDPEDFKIGGVVFDSE